MDELFGRRWAHYGALIVMVIALAACGGEAPEPQTPPPAPEQAPAAPPEPVRRK
jgi:hypothetical protein